MERTIFYHHITILEILYIVNSRVFTKTTALYRLKLECERFIKGEANRYFALVEKQTPKVFSFSLDKAVFLLRCAVVLRTQVHNSSAEQGHHHLYHSRRGGRSSTHHVVLAYSNDRSGFSVSGVMAQATRPFPSLLSSE